MPFEYAVWAKTPEWAGQNDETRHPPLVLSDEVYRVLSSAVVPPPYRGGTPKTYANAFTRIFLHFDSKLLSPANARAVAAWLREWADAHGGLAAGGHTAQPGEASGDPVVARSALRAAAWLDRAADDGWYVDWTAY